MNQNMKIAEGCRMDGRNLPPSHRTGVGYVRNLLTSSVLCVAAVAQTASAADRCEIVFTNSQAAVLRADTLTGGHGVIAKESELMQPFGIAVGQNGELFISDTGCLGLLGIDPASGDQRLITRGGLLGVPFGIAVERNGMILVANAHALLRVDPETGAQSPLPSPLPAQSSFQFPLAVAVAENGDIFVADALGPIVRVDPNSGAQTLISSGGYPQRPQGIAVRGNNLYVTDVATSDMNFGIGRIIRIDINTGQQSELSRGENL